MYSILKILLFFLLSTSMMAQNESYLTELNQKQADSLQLILNSTDNDTLRMSISRDLGIHYIERNKETAIQLFKDQVAYANKLELKLWEADGYALLTYAEAKSGTYINSMNAFLKGMNIAENENCEKNIWNIEKFSIDKDPGKARLLVLAHLHIQVGHLYRATQKIDEEKFNYSECLRLAEQIKDHTFSHFGAHMLGGTYITLNKLDSALYYEQKAIEYSDKSGYRKYRGQIFEFIGSIYSKKGQYDEAKKYFNLGIKTNKEQNNLPFLANIYVLMADMFQNTGKPDSSLFYGKNALDIYKYVGELPGMLASYRSLSSAYKMQNNIDSAFHYQDLAFAANDLLNDPKKINQFQNIGFDEQLRVMELEREKIEKENTVRTFAMLSGIAIVMLVAFLLYRTTRIRRKANDLLKIQKGEIELQKQNIEEALANLKATQSQLIHSEKMASLGELTAGIAHEIQNPLNFVNNFSEVSGEMIDEANEEISNGDLEETKSILNDLKGNLEKITHHGKRASGIVKGMLDHSRVGSGEKMETDINALCDEYLRLAYHACLAGRQGLRAKDNSFNASYETSFDESLPIVNVVSQDIGRVLLNLINNAFHACSERSNATKTDHSVSVVSEKSKSLTGLQALSGVDDYKPKVIVSTELLGDIITIKVSDNGPGIPEDIKDKIFQPFFTTKPTGQGTGLGLSLSYDIVKAHGGTISVKSLEGEGTIFTITLPLLMKNMNYETNVNQ